MKNLILLLFFFLPSYVFCQQNMLKTIAENPYINRKKIKLKDISDLSNNKNFNLLDIKTDFYLDSCYYILNKITDEYTLYSKYPINKGGSVGWEIFREYLYIDKVNSRYFLLKYANGIEIVKVINSYIRIKPSLKKTILQTNEYLTEIYELAINYPFSPVLFLYYESVFVISEEPKEYENGDFIYLMIYPTPNDYPNHPYRINFDNYNPISKNEDIMHNINDISHDRFLEILNNIKNKAKEYGVRPFYKVK